MQVGEKTITIQGLKTVYLTGGEGEPLVFIPGWGAQGKTYKAALTKLSEKYHVFAPDLPGFGKADTPASVWDFTNYADFITSFISELSLRNVTLIGHSTGGAIALHTVTKSKAVKRLILIDPYGLPLEHSRLRLISRYLLEFLLATWQSLQVRTFLTASTNIFTILRNYRYTFPYSLGIFNESVKSDRSLFQDIHTPTLIIWGDKDIIFGKDYATSMKEALPEAKLVEVKGTHNWILFEPDVLLRSI